jgi:hypothetical protein
MSIKGCMTIIASRILFGISFLNRKLTSNVLIIVFGIVAMEVEVSPTFENFKIACRGVAIFWLKIFNPNSTCWKFVELS